MPHTQWVVKLLSTTDQFASVTSTSTYHYDAPHWSQDDVGRWGFRGFDAVHTTSPRGAVTEDRYDYSVDWSGRLRTSLVFPSETPSAPTTISDTDMIAERLFGGNVTVFEPAVVRTWTCGAGKTESQCRAAPSGFTKTVSTWTPQASTTAASGPSLLYVESVHVLQAGESPADGDRSITTTYALDADGSTYRLRATDALSQLQSGGALTTYAHTRHDYDPAFLVELHTTQWVDSIDADASVTEHQYDMATGNVTAKREPEQYAANKNAFTTFTYDTKKLFVSNTVDPLGHHSIGTVYDYGTGTLLRTIGPNYCSGLCQSGAQAQEKRTDVDGLGRPIASWVAIDSMAPPNGHYTLAEVSTTSYVDSVTSGVATSVTTQNLIEYDDTRWTKEKVELDGHGRPFRKTTYVQGTAPADAITTFTYDAIGKLSQTTVPDASLNSAATVTFTYGFDSTGRPTSMRRPGPAGGQSGINVSYDGVTETRTEVAGSAGGSAATTQLVHDSFGRLVTVNEQLTGGAFATTQYAYDANDNIHQIIDPEGLVTTIDHDLASRRIAITRGSNRPWSFKYDRNGNVVAETAPPPSDSAADKVAYTTTYAFDDDDRVTSRVVGSRWMSTADQDLFGVGEVDYTYDTGINGNDRLDVVVTHSTTSTPRTVLTSTLAYDAEGNQTTDQRTVNLAGVTKTFTNNQTYAPFGKPRQTTYADSSTPSKSRVLYDNRALPSQAQYTPPGSSTYTTLGVQTRNVAGLVTQRETIVGFTRYDQTWSYDNIGRVLETDVSRAGTLWAQQQLTYAGLDDPSTMVQQYTAAAVGTAINKSFSYSYDPRHQLAQVHENSSAFSGTFAFKSSGRFDRVTVGAAALSGSDVKPRDVYYEYNASDPEAVSRLRNATDGTSFATYQYDTAGNMTSRTYAAPAATWSFVYDGDDQLRRATQSGVGVEEYFYDHTGARIGIVKRNASNTVTEVRYFHGGDTEVWLSQGGTITEGYAYVSMGTPIARAVNGSDIDLEFHSPLSNLLFTIEAIGTHPGIASSAFVYGPYGELVQTYQGWSPCGAIASVPCHRRRFNDKYVDELDSLSYYGARYYDPISLTWTQPDPAYRFTKDNAWDQPRRANLYDFVLHSPLELIDPDGRGALGAFVLERTGSCPDGVDCSSGDLPTAILEHVVPEAGWVDDLASGGSLKNAVADIQRQQSTGSGWDVVNNAINSGPLDRGQTPSANSGVPTGGPGTPTSGGDIGAGGGGSGGGGGGDAPKVHSAYADGTQVLEGKQPPRIAGPATGEDGTRVDAPHTVLRRDTGNDRIYQGRTFDADGNPVRDTDFTSPTFPSGKPRPDHAPAPHTHDWSPNDPSKGAKSGMKRDKNARPL
jgi:RHS repeat-associated protein